MKFWVTLDDHEAEVEFTADGGRLWLEVEGDRIEADFARLPDGEVYSLLVGGKSHEVRVSPENGRLDVTLNGALLAVEVRHPLEKALVLRFPDRQDRHLGPSPPGVRDQEAPRRHLRLLLLQAHSGEQPAGEA
jgi:hypothetical protein